MEYNVIRGLVQIGGNAIEVTSNGSRILLDVGRALDDKGTSDEEVIKVLSKSNYDAVLITHYHEDHLGLFEHMPADTKYYIGEKAYKILTSSRGYLGLNIFKPESFLRDGEEITIGDLRVTPYLCDHSAMDSYMLLVQDGEEKLLYTGDFRSNGRKSFDALLNKLPRDIDILISEGTTLFGNHVLNSTEVGLQHNLTEEVSKYSGPVFVLQAATNIDRIVTMYKVARKNNRLMLQDLYMSSITTALGGNIPNPVGFNTVRTYISTGYDDDNPRRKLFESLREYMVGKSRLADLDFIMNIRPSQLKYLQSLSESVDFSGGLLIVSMWSGYLDRPEFKKLIEFMENSDVKVIEGHVSGHADIETINRLISHTSPKETVIVHTEIGNGSKPRCDLSLHPGKGI